MNEMSFTFLNELGFHNLSIYTDDISLPANVWKNTALGLLQMISLHQEVEDLRGIIGPMCSDVCQAMALLAAAWNLPVVSYYCPSNALSDKSQYPTFARVMGLDHAEIAIINGVMDEFGWRRVAIVGTTLEQYSVLAREAKTILQQFNKTVIYHVINPVTVADSNWMDDDALQEMENIVVTVKKETSFICFFMSPKDIHIFLLKALDNGMLNGQWAFYGRDIYLNHGPAVNSEYPPGVDLMTLYQGVLTETIPTVESAEWTQLQQQVVEEFADPRFTGLQAVTNPDDVLVLAGFLYDAVLLWAYGMNRSLEEGASPDDGMAVVSNMFNFTFDGITGRVAIDDHGGRKIDRIVSILQPGPQLTLLFRWIGAEGRLEKVYSSPDSGDWTGLTWSGGATTVPTEFPVCGWQNELCLSPQGGWSQGAIAGVCLVAVLGSIMLCVHVYIYKWFTFRNKMLEAHDCFLTLVSGPPALATTDPATPFDDSGSRSIHDLLNNDHTTNDLLSSNRTLKRVFNGRIVAMRGYNCQIGLSKNKTFLEEIYRVKHGSEHKHLNHLIGVWFGSAGRMHIVMDYFSRGSLHDIIGDASIKFNHGLRLSLLTDIVRGMRYLHIRLKDIHGHLSSHNCIVNGSWVVKITDYGFREVRKTQRLCDEPDEKKFWVAPEILREETEPSQAGDVYSFGIIASEIITEQHPYAWQLQRMAAADIVDHIKSSLFTPFRPELTSLDDHNSESEVMQPACSDGYLAQESDPALSSEGWVRLVRMCWNEDGKQRPSFSAVLEDMKSINGGELPSLVDAMVRNLEEWTTKQEDIVAERTADVRAEKAKLEFLLSELLPPAISAQLKVGNQVKPEAFDEVTICVADIVGFTAVSSAASPMQVIKMLNSLYLKFDNVLTKYDVYKVATIGDAYQVASGVPFRNDDRHAEEIASMALHLLDVIEAFDIPHDADKKLYLRIGLHTGPCVAGVTGVKTPRYLLFGQTVDIAAQIEARGEAMKIHISDSSARILGATKRYDMTVRGNIDIRGVRSFMTYWLNSEYQHGSIMLQE